MQLNNLSNEKYIIIANCASHNSFTKALLNELYYHIHFNVL